MSNEKLKNPSVLAFEAKLLPSDALMFSGNWDSDNWKPILVTEKSVRGTISERQKAAIANDPIKLDKKISNANLQTVDIAALPHANDTLKVIFSLRVLNNLQLPSTCNSPSYQDALAKKITQYQQETRFEELSERYAQNIANGRFLWRNRMGADAVKIEVEIDNKNFIFDSFDYSLREFNADSNIKKVAEAIQKGLTEKHAFIKVTAYCKLGSGQTVFPSQELVIGSSKGDKSKFLYQINKQAAIHSQKIGNAIRSIDTWYPQADEIGPIAIEPYGSVTNRGVAYRQPKDKKDFYNLLDAWMLKDKIPSLDQQHYLMAMLIRGGVFGE